MPPRLIFIQNFLIIYVMVILNKYELSDSLLEQMASLVLIQPQGGWLPDVPIHTCLFGECYSSIFSGFVTHFSSFLGYKKKI